jgi:hypothetical protein
MLPVMFRDPDQHLKNTWLFHMEIHRMGMNVNGLQWSSLLYVPFHLYIHSTTHGQRSITQH